VITAVSIESLNNLGEMENFIEDSCVQQSAGDGYDGAG
jgi:hypothetical protein